MVYGAAIDSFDLIDSAAASCVVKDALDLAPERV